MDDRITNDMVLFYGQNSVFSNFYLADFIDSDGVKYICTEQYFQHKKMLQCQEHTIAEKILISTNAAEIRHLGRSRSELFDVQQWNRDSEQVLFDGNWLKYNQNEYLKRFLLNTNNKILAEANPRDCIWGIGLNMWHKNATVQAKWQGLNKFGEILMHIRYFIRNKML